MKKMLLFFLIIISVTVTGQSKAIRYFKITQKQCLNRSGYTLVLKEVTTDSRCPQGVQCVWMGEAQVVVSLYRDKKLIEDIAITISPNTLQQNKELIAKYSKEKYKNIQTVSLSPYPKKEQVVKPTDYYLKIWYVK